MPSFPPFLCAVAGVPLSWAKTARGGGRDTVTWVGFEMSHRTTQLGISQRRADWFMKWASEVAASRTVNMISFEEGLGRVMYVAGALEYERPFLGPLYKFMSFTRVTRSSPYPRTLLSSFGTSHSSCRTPDTTIAQPICIPASCPSMSMHRQVPSELGSEGGCSSEVPRKRSTRTCPSGSRWR